MWHCFFFRAYVNIELPQKQKKLHVSVMNIKRWQKILKIDNRRDENEHGNGKHRNINAQNVQILSEKKEKMNKKQRE